MSPQHAMIHETDTAPECPGRGRCHTTSWCPDCDATAHGPCDVRARAGRCDRHPPAAELHAKLVALHTDRGQVDIEIAEADRRARAMERAAAATRARHTAKVREHRSITTAIAEMERRLNAADADVGGVW